MYQFALTLSLISTRDDPATEYSHTLQILEELGYEEVHESDLTHVQFICAQVSRRAAFLASAGIATLLNRINDPNVTVAVDGSLYRYHPFFHDLMIHKIEQMLNPGLKVSREAVLTFAEVKGCNNFCVLLCGGFSNFQRSFLL